jgi:hypothetical protein
MPGARSVPSFVADRPLSRRALGLARSGHAGQRGASDGAPFVLHPSERVARIVAAVTEDPTIRSVAARKDALSVKVAESGADAALVYAADKVEKVRELRLRVRREGPQALLLEEARTKLRHYATAFSVVAHALDEHPVVQQLRSELAALRAIPEADLATALPPERHPR